MELLSILCNGIGLSLIDKYLVEILDHMSKNPPDVLSDTIMGWAKMIGLCIALGVGSYECYMMMLGRRGMDVMKILHILIISICISLSGSIVQALDKPCMALADVAKDAATQQVAGLDMKEKQISELKIQYADSLTSRLAFSYLTKESDEMSTTDMVMAVADVIRLKRNVIENLWRYVEAKLTEWISSFIRWVAEVIFQVVFFGLFLASAIFKNILAIFAPLAFALSLAPPFRSAWSQWLSKYVSIALWPFVAYTIFLYVCYILEYYLDLDVKMYTEHLVNMEKTASGELYSGLKLGFSGLGTTIMYVVGLCIGVWILTYVPEVASWLVPGGVSSGAGAIRAATTGAIASTAAAPVKLAKVAM